MEPSKRELGIRKAQADEMVISQRKLSEWRKGLSSTSQCQGRRAAETSSSASAQTGHAFLCSKEGRRSCKDRIIPEGARLSKNKVVWMFWWGFLFICFVLYDAEFVNEE